MLEAKPAFSHHIPLVISSLCTFLNGLRYFATIITVITISYVSKNGKLGNNSSKRQNARTKWKMEVHYNIIVHMQ
jgi:hypothetical protein